MKKQGQMKKGWCKRLLVLGAVWMGASAASAGVVGAIDPACMLCVATVGAGLAISRALGVNDVLVGVWAGGLFWAAGTWVGELLKKKWPKVKLINVIYMVVFYGLVGWGLQRMHYFEGLQPFLGWMVNPLLLGMVVGTICLAAGISTDKYLRTKSANGKAFFPFQKVVVPLVWLLVGTTLMWLAI